MSKSKKAQVPPKSKRRAPLLMALEPRLMFDGAVAASTHAITAEHHDHVLASSVSDRHAILPHLMVPPRPPAAAQPNDAAQANDTPHADATSLTADRGHGGRAPGVAAATTPTAPAVVFIDSRVEDPTSLLSGIAAGTEIVYLQADKDGLQQISSYLSHHHEVGSVEIIAHGSDAQLQLGSTDLNSSNIAGFAGELATVGRNLRSGADILVYACDTAADARGVGFVNALSVETGHVVAASSNVTGAGGDWKLEITTGTVTAASALSSTAEAHYAYALSSLTAATDAQLKTAIATADADALGNDTITLTSNITFASAADTLNITHPGTGVLTIDGGGHTIDAAYLNRVLSVTSGRVILENVTITHGLIAGAGGANLAAGGAALGAGINNAGNLTLFNVNVTSNYATGGGGGGGGAVQTIAPNVSASGGGGGSGVGTGSGAVGGAGISGTTVISGGAASSTTGGSGGVVPHGAAGIGGSATGGGAGGAGSTSASGAYASGAAGATATAGSFTVGGGGGGSGRAGTGGSGGAAAGGIYNSGVLYVAGTSAITGNAAAGGGGGGGGGTLTSGGNGGQGVGGIMNSALGTVKITSGALASMIGNSGVSGAIGAVVNGGSNALLTQPTAYNNLNTSGSITTNYSPATVTSITRTGGSNPNNGTTEQYTVVFSQAVTGLNTLDFVLTNTGTAGGVITGVTGSGTTYTVTVGAVLGDGTMRLDLVNNPPLLLDGSGSPLLAGYTSGQTYTLDHTAPYATAINLVGSTINNATTEQFTVNFSENVSGVDTTDFTLVDGGTAHGTIASVSGSGSTYTVTVNNVSGNGTMQLDLNIANTGIADSVGNGIVGGFLTGQTYTLQHTGPSVTSITTVGSSSNNAASDQYTVNFSEAVTGVNALDFSLTNTGTAGGVISNVSGSGSTYTVTVAPATGTGTMRLDVNSNAPIVDLAGNTLTGGYTSGQVYTLDHTVPFATAINTVGTSPNNATTEQFSVVFSENVSGVDTSDFTLVNTGTVQGAIAAVSGSGSTYTVTVNNVSGNGTMQLDLNALNTGITDSVGNAIAGGFLTGQVYTLQHTAPAVTSIVPVTASPNGALSDQYTVTFSENVVGVDITDFHLTNTGTAGGVISAVTGSGSVYTVTVAPAAGDGTMRLDLNSSGTGIVDYAGNSISGGYSSGGVITVDHTAPVVTSINTVGSNPNNASTEQFTVNFSEAVTGVDASDFTLVNTGTVNGAIATVSGSGSTYTVTVNNVNGNGTMQLDLNALGTGISDAAGNANVGGYALGQTYTLQHSAPVVTSIVAVNPSPNNATAEQFTVTFSENVVGVDALDFHLTDTGTAAGTISAVTGSGSVYTVTVAPAAGDGTMRLDLNSSGTGIVDYSGNTLNGGFTGGTVVTLEHTPPTATSIALLSPNPTSATSDQFQVTFSENVTGVDTADFSLVNTGTVGATVASVTGSGNTYTVTVNNVVGTGTMELALNALNTGITDAAGNALVGGALSSAYTVAAGPGVVSITPVTPGPNNASTEVFTVDFNTAVTGVDSSDFTLTDTGTAGGTIGTVTGAGSVYTVTVNNASGDGTLRLDLNASGTGIADLSNTPVSGGFTGGTSITLDHTNPSVTSIVPVSATADGSTESFTVNFSENVVGVTAADFSLTNSNNVTGNIASVTGSGSTYTVNVTGVTGDGTSRLDLNANAPIADLAGNFVVGGYTAGGTVDVDHTPPSVTSITRVGPNPNNANSDQYTVTFSENVTGVDTSDFSLTDTNGVAGTVTAVTGSGSTYTVTVSNVTGDGTMRLDLNASGTGITDIAGNAIGGGYTSGQVYTIEHTPPSVTSIALVGASPNSASSDQYTVTFSENVTGVDASDFVLTNGGGVAGTIANVSGSGSTYTVTVNNVTGDGTMRLDLNASGTGIADAAGNAISGGYTAGPSYTIEHTPPSVTSIALVGPSTNNASSDQFTVTFSENVTGVDASDFALTNSGGVAGTITSVTGSGSTYTVTVGSVTGDGTMRLDLNASGTGITDAAGNSIAGGYTAGASYTIEHTPPSVTSIGLVDSNPNNAGTEHFTVNFSEGVNGVDIGDFSLTTSGTATGTIASITGSGSTYTVTVNNVSGDGTMRLDLNTSGTGITDAAGNVISGGFTTGASYTLGHSGPVVSSITTVGASTNSAGSDQFTVTFSENVTGVDAGDFALTNTGGVAGTITSVTGSGSTYTVTVGSVTGNGTMRLDLNASGTGITDAAGNAISGGYTAGASYTIEHTPPSVTSIGLAGQSPNNASTEQYTVTFSENVTGVDASDFALTTTGNAVGTIASVTGSGNSYTVTVNNVSGDGTMRLDLNPSGTGITDAAGNAISGGYTAGASYTIEHTPPSITSITTVGATTNNANGDQYTVTFSENVTGVDAGDFALTTTGNVSGAITSVTGSGNTYTVTVGNVTGDGTMRLDLNASGTGITDAAGNGVSGGFTAGASYTIEHTPPSVASISLAGPNPSFAASDQYTVTFSENVTGVDVGDFVLTNQGTVAGTISSVTGSGNVYTVTVSSVSGIGTMRLDLNASGTGITDAAGNSISGGFTTGASYVVGQTAPVVTSIALVDPATNNAPTDQFTVTFSENVTGVDVSDFSLTNGGTAAGTVSSVTGSGSTYTVTVSNVTGDGTMRLDLNASGTGIQNALAQPVVGGYTSGPSYMIEHTPPSVTSIALIDASVNNAGSEQFTVTFSENITGVDASDFALTNGGSVAGTIASVSGSGNTYVVTANNVTGDGTMRLDLNAAGTGITDAAGNAIATGYTVGPSYTIEHTPPSVTSIALVGPSSNNAGSEQFTVTFSENVTGVDVSDFALTNTGTVAGTISSVVGSGSTYVVTVANVSGDGTMRLDLNASNTGIGDAAGNAIAGGYATGPAYTIAHTAPNVASIALVGASPNHAASDSYTVTFSENVTGVDVSDFALTATGTAAGSIASVTGSGSTYTVVVNGVTGDGTLRLDVNNAGTGITDATGNALATGFQSGPAYTIEHTAPVATSITATAPTANNATSETYTVTFSENVTGVDVSDFVLTNTGSVSGSIASVTGSGNTYTVTVNNVAGDGTMRLDLNPAGTGIVDAAGNAINGGFATGDVYTIEHSAPVVSTINTVGANPNNSSSEQFTVTFSQDVSGVDIGDFVLANTGTAAGTITQVTGSGSTYTVTVNGVSGDGTMRLDLNPSGTGITDATGNAIAGGFTGGEVYVLGHTAPVVASIDTTGNTSNNASSETYTVTFNENVTGVDAADFVLTSTGTAAGTITGVTGSGNTYTVTVANVTGDGTLRLDLNGTGTGITDAAGNAIAGPYTSGQLYTVAHTVPTVITDAAAGANPSNASTETFDVTFSADVTGVDASDFTLSSTGTAAGTITSVTGSGNSYAITVSNVTGDGTLRLDLNGTGTAIVDAVGNAVAAFSTGQAVTIDHTAPTLTAITPVGPQPSNATTDQFNVTFSEAVTGVTAADFVLVETGSAAGTITGVSGSGHNYTVTVDGVTGDGTLAVNLSSSGTGISDIAGNALNTVSSAGSSLIVEHSAPVVTAVTGPAEGVYATGQNLDFTVHYNENVTLDTTNGVPYIDLTLDNGTVVHATYVSGSGTNALVFQYTVAAGNTDMNGLTVGSTVELNGGRIQDTAGNSASTTLENTAPTTNVVLDTSAPSVASIDRDGPALTNSNTLTYTVTFSENVNGVNASDFTVTATGSAAGTVTSVTRVSGNTYEVTVGNVTGDGTVRLDLGTQSGNITDAAGNQASGGFTSGESITVDHTSPAITAVSAPVGNTYGAGATLEYTVTFSEPVSVNGTPDLDLNIGGTVGHFATYVSGNGTNTLTFRYTVTSSDQGVGVTVIGLDLNGGSITDAAGNVSVPTLSNVAPGTGVIVGGVPPVVTPIVPPVVTPLSHDTGQSDFVADNDFQPLQSSDVASSLAASSQLPPDSLTTDIEQFMRTQDASIGTVDLKSVSAGLNYPTLTHPVESNFSVTLPISSFQFDPGTVVTIQAMQTNGSTLPSWLSFDPTTGKFEGAAPAGWSRPVDILITARDQTGHEVMLQLQLKFTEASSNNLPDSGHSPDGGRDALRLAQRAVRSGPARLAKLSDRLHAKHAAGKPSLADQFSQHGRSAQQRNLDALTRRVS